MKWCCEQFKKSAPAADGTCWPPMCAVCHVHAVVVMNDFKSYSSRALNSMEVDVPDRKRWARHGSTRWLWDTKAVSAAIRYVADEQGEPMAVFEASAL